jgi:hypothetical protein
MALIKIANVYNSEMAVNIAGRGWFTVLGEPVVVVDLINTVAAPGSSTGEDLLSADRGAEAWKAVGQPYPMLPHCWLLLRYAGYHAGWERRWQAGGVGSIRWGRSAIRTGHEPTSRI